MTKFIFGLFLIVLVLYLAFGLFLYFNQRNILYYPTKQDFHDCSALSSYSQINIKGTRFYFLKRGKDVLVFYHGNAGSACDRAFLKPLLENSDKSILIVEYSGYSNDSRKPSKKLILQDVHHISDFLNKEKFDSVSIMGESLGSAVAAYHASISPKVNNLLFLAPFSNLSDLVQSLYPVYPIRFLLKDNYTTLKWLKGYKGKVTIIHGDRDGIVPHAFSEQPHNGLNTINVEYHLISKGGHNNLFDFSEVAKKISAFLKN